MGCCTSQQFAGKTSPPKAGETNGNRPLSQLPAVKFISTDCKCIVNISARRVLLHRIEQKELTSNCATITRGDSIFVLSGGLEGDAVFWEVLSETSQQLPTPSIPVIGGTFIANGRWLLLVGAKVQGSTGNLVLGPLLQYDTKRRRWKVLIDHTSLPQVSNRADIHPCLLSGAGVCLRPGTEDHEPMLLFVGGEYLLNGKLVQNEKVLWLELNSWVNGAFNIVLPTKLKNPHILAIGTSEILVAGGTNLTTNKKSKRVLKIDTAGDGTLTEVGMLHHPLATCNIVPAEFTEYVVFFSWPRITFYHKVSKNSVNISIRKAGAFRTEGLTHKRHDSMGSDVSSTAEVDVDILARGSLPNLGVKRSIGVEGSYGIQTGFSVKQVTLKSEAKVEEKKVPSRKPIEAEPEPNAPKPKPAANIEVRVEGVKTKKRRHKNSSSSSSSSSDQGKHTVKHVGALIKRRDDSEEEIIAPINMVKGGKSEKIRTKGGFDVKIKSTRRGSSSSSSDSVRKGVPGRVMIGLSSLTKKYLPPSAKIGGGTKAKKSSGSSSDDHKATHIVVKNQVYKEDFKNSDVKVEVKGKKNTAPAGLHSDKAKINGGFKADFGKKRSSSSSSSDLNAAKVQIGIVRPKVGVKHRSSSSDDQKVVVKAGNIGIKAKRSSSSSSNDPKKAKAKVVIPSAKANIGGGLKAKFGKQQRSSSSDEEMQLQAKSKVQISGSKAKVGKRGSSSSSSDSKKGKVKVALPSGKVQIGGGMKTKFGGNRSSSSSDEESKRVKVQIGGSNKKSAAFGVKLSGKGKAGKDSSSSESDGGVKLTLRTATKCNEILAEVAGYDADYTEFTEKILEGDTKNLKFSNLKAGMKVSIPEGTRIKADVFPQFFSRLADFLKTNPLRQRDVNELIGTTQIVNKRNAIKVACQGLKKLMKQG